MVGALTAAVPAVSLCSSFTSIPNITRDSWRPEAGVRRDSACSVCPRAESTSHSEDGRDWRVSRRQVVQAPIVLSAASLSLAAVSSPAPALAETLLGDPSFTLEQVTREVTPAGKLPPSEEATIAVFERATYSVVNVFDATLRPSANFQGGVEVPEGNGSGLVWDQEGNIITNFHVIASALRNGAKPGTPVARVALLGADGYQKNYSAVLVGADRTKDLAVIKVDAPPELLRPVPLGRSAFVRVGQRCLAIGNPFGFDHTLTAGIVSGLERDIQSQMGSVIAGGIQTDASINPGNSGGPLLDSSGSLIGINTAIFTATGTSAGVGFAIPADLVARVVPQLIQYGRVMRPNLNIQVATDNVARQLNVNKGALVLSVPERSAAAKAGLLATRRGLAGNIVPGDVIINVGDMPVRNSTDLSKVLDEFQIGQQVVLRVEREGRQLELPLALEDAQK